MSAFKFDFDAQDHHAPIFAEKTDASSKDVEAVFLSFDRQDASQNTVEEALSQSTTEEVQITPSFSICKGIVSSQAASSLLQNAELAVSDLVPGQYEGGFKLWECAVDLSRYLCQIWGIQDAHDITSAMNERHLHGRRVLELGCGQGLPGILAAMCGMEVHFQDYNREVLTSLTMPNLAANLRRLLADRDSLPQPRFIAGSWASLPQLLQEQGLSGSYDFVFSTDTIYSVNSHQQLLDCIHESLRPGGSALIGAKSYYFGVGGSIASFKKLVNESRQFECVTVAILDNGASNVRVILQLTKKNKS